MANISKVKTKKDLTDVTSIEAWELSKDLVLSIEAWELSKDLVLSIAARERSKDFIKHISHCLNNQKKSVSHQPSKPQHVDFQYFSYCSSV